MKYFLALSVLLASCVVAAAQGCGPSNPNCIVPTAPPNTNNNQAASTAFVQQAIGGPAANVVNGPATSVVGDLALWNNATGNLLKDVAIQGAVVSVVNPSSGNLVGSGCSISNQVLVGNQNICLGSDTFKFTSSDISAAFSLTIGGSVTTGDAISLTITMGSGNCSGAGCTVTTGAATGGDTLTTLAGKLACAIANNSSLFNLNGGSCSAGSVTPAAGSSYGGYGSGNPIGYVVISGVGLAFDFNSNVSLKVTSSVSGSATETVTINNTNCGTRCSFALDNNPNIQMVRQSGAAPQPGSALSAIFSEGATSSCASTSCVNYGVIVTYIGNSTAGSLRSAYLIQTPNTSGTLANGFYFGQGEFANIGCAVPLGSTPAGCVQDQGAGSINLPAVDSATNGGYWLDGVDSITRNRGSGQFIILGGGSDDIILSATNGIGINTTPSVGTFTNALPQVNSAKTTLNIASTIASATAATLDDLNLQAATTTITGNTGSPITRLAKAGLYRPTITDSSSVTVTDAATLYIDNSPLAAGSVTITNPWSLLVGSGSTKLQATTINGALTYGGVTLSNAVTGTGNMVLATSPALTTPAVTGGTIDNASIGATTPAAGKFTSLNASGQITSTTGLPTIASGACGATTNGAVVSGSTNQSGQITIGSAATTTCTITWSTTLAAVPNACVFFPMNAAAAATGTTVARVGAPTNTQVVLTGSALANANYAYICL